MLSAEQQKTIENSLWVVNTALKRLGLQGNADLKQDGLAYMCKCIERFDPTRNIKWTTYAYKNVFLYLKRLNARQCELKTMQVRVKNIELIQQDFGADCLYDDFLDSVKEVCTEQELLIIRLRIYGYNGKEIAKQLNIKPKALNGIIHNIKTKIGSILNE